MSFASALDGFPTTWTAVQLVTMSRRSAEVVFARRRFDGVEVERITSGALDRVVLSNEDVVCWRALESVDIAEPAPVRKSPKLSVVR